MVEALGEITASFNDLIEVYESFISESQKTATDLLWRYAESNNLLNTQDASISFYRLLFRGRTRGNIDPLDITQYYHIPFDKRHFVSNQRFSISGQPMVYFGSSALCVSKELGAKMDDLYVAAFAPNRLLKNRPS